MGNFGQYDTRTGWTGNSPLFDHATDDPDVVAGANALAQAGRSSAFIGSYLHHSAFTTFSATRWADSRIRNDPCLPGFAHPFGGGAQNNSGMLSFEARAICGLFGNDDCGEDWDIQKGPCDPPDPSRPGWEEQTTPVGKPLPECTFELTPAQEWGSCADRARLAPEALVERCGAPLCGSCPVLTEEAVDEARRSLSLTFSHRFDNDADLLAPDDEDTERALIEDAWTILYNTLDLIRWAACYVEGEELGECLVNKITRPGRMNIVVADDILCEIGKASFCTFVDPLWGFQEVIHIGRGDTWNRFLQAYGESRRCGAVALAATLLHELWHACNAFKWLDTNECDPPYLLENLYRWAVYQRCSGTVEHSCCQYEWDSISNMYDGDIVYPCSPKPS